jgi:hypothetical protein
VDTPRFENDALKTHPAALRIGLALAGGVLPFGSVRKFDTFVPY